MMDAKKISIALTHDEELVIDAFFARFEKTNRFELNNNAEYIAFQKISALLDLSLEQTLNANYMQLLNEATARLSYGCEGVVPGVVES